MKTTKLSYGWLFTKNGVTEPVTIPHDFMIGTARTPESPAGADYGCFQPGGVTVEGGTVVGAGSVKTDDEHDYTDNKCRAYHGRILAAILPAGSSVTVTADTERLSATKEIDLSCG